MRCAKCKKEHAPNQKECVFKNIGYVQTEEEYSNNPILIVDNFVSDLCASAQLPDDSSSSDSSCSYDSSSYCDSSSSSDFSSCGDF